MALYSFSGPGRDPGDGLEQARRDLGTLLDAWGARLGTASGGVYPPVNLYETAEGYVLTAEVPGVRQEDLQISIEKNRVTLRGERKIEHPEGETAVHRRERRTGVFHRAVTLPFPINADKTEATYRHGVLALRLPKRAEDQPRQITVNTR